MSNNGQAYDEAAAGPQPPAAPAPSHSPHDDAIAALAGHRHLTYFEREHGTYGGRIDIVDPDGQPVAVAEGEMKSGTTGLMGKDLPIHLTAAGGLRLGTLLRKRYTVREDHPVFDPNGIMMGEFIGPAGLTTEARIQCGAGTVAALTLGPAGNFLVEASGRPLARVTHAESQEDLAFKVRRGAMPGQFRNDTFVLEPLAPMAPWMFLFALLAPIEVNLREDTARQQMRVSRHDN